MKKQLLTILLTILLMTYSVSAEPFATISMLGLSFVNPQAATLLQNLMCVAGPVGVIVCAEQYVGGKIIGQVTGAVYQQVAEASPELARAINMYNQIKGYIDTGATIIEEMKLTQEGALESGKMEFANTQAHIGNLIGKDIAPDRVSVANVIFEKKEKINTLIMKDNGLLTLKIKDTTGKDIGFAYSNIKEGGKLELNEEGKITGASFFTNEKGGTYVFGKDEINVPGNTQVLFDKGTITLQPEDSATLKQLPTQLTNIEAEDNTIILKPAEGKVLNLPEGIQLQEGAITFKNGQAVIKKNDKTILNKIHLSSEDTDIDLFFDGKKHDKQNYVSINSKKNQINAHAEGNNIIMKFLPGTTIFDQEETDRTEFLLYGGSLQLQREGDNVLPLVNYNSDWKSIEETRQLKTISDSNGLEVYNNNRMRWILDTENKKSSPFIFQANDENGEDIIGTKKFPIKIAFDDQENIIAIPANFQIESKADFVKAREENLAMISQLVFPSEKDAQLLEKLDTSSYFSLNDEEKENLKIWAAKKVLSSRNIPSVVEIKFIKESLEELPTQLKRAVKYYEILPLSEYYMMCGENSIACVSYDSQSTIKTQGSIMKSVLIHEAAHTMTNHILSKDNFFSPLHGGPNEALMHNIESLKERNGLTYLDPVTLKTNARYVNPLSTEERKDLLENLRSVNPDSFASQWAEISWQDYGRLRFKDKYYEAGCVSAYGCTNLHEDISEYTRIVYTPEYLEELKKNLNPKIEKKLKLLTDAGYITEDKYQEIVNTKP